MKQRTEAISPIGNPHRDSIRRRARNPEYRAELERLAPWRRERSERARKGHDLVVAPDGSIPADQLARLGVAPGAHLRVVQTSQAATLAGALPDFPDLAWEEFEHASALAKRDLTAT